MSKLLKVWPIRAVMASYAGLFIQIGIVKIIMTTFLIGTFVQFENRTKNLTLKYKSIVQSCNITVMATILGVRQLFSLYIDCIQFVKEQHGTLYI